VASGYRIPQPAAAPALASRESEEALALDIGTDVNQAQAFAQHHREVGLQTRNAWVRILGLWVVR
jgi:hypothetical protein